MDAEMMIHDFACGNGSVADLAILSILIEGEPPQLEVTIPAGTPEVQVSPADLSRGLLAAWARGTDLGEWAAATRSLVILDGEDSPVWEVLMNALWAASFGDPIPDEALTLARSLAG
jgi:hypothetical protein